MVYEPIASFPLSKSLGNRLENMRAMDTSGIDKAQHSRQLPVFICNFPFQLVSF